MKDRLIHHDFNALCLDALHYALNRAGAEVIGIAFHCKAVNADFFRLPIYNHLGDVVFAGRVALHNRAYKVLRNIVAVCKELLCILWQTVSAITKRGVIVMTANTRIETYTFDYLLSIKTLYLSIGVQLIKIADTKCKICIRKAYFFCEMFEYIRSYCSQFVLASNLL